MKIITFPKVGVKFRLELKRDQRDGLSLVDSILGYDADKWSYLRRQMIPGGVGYFKIWPQGKSLNNLEELISELKKNKLKAPPGQWIVALKDAYGGGDCEVSSGRNDGYIGVADPSWISPKGRIFFPGMFQAGFTSFFDTDISLPSNWSWLVCCK